MGYTLIVMMLTESFPMSVQATCAGIIEAIAQLGSFFGPVIITVCINMQIYPVIALSLIAMVVILLPLCFLKVRRPEMKMEESLLVQDSLVVGKAE
jgi:MFS family permease